MDNEELISKFENVTIEYGILLKEIMIKTLNKEISDEQNERIENIISSYTSNMFDAIMSKTGVDRQTLRQSANNLVDEYTDENR